MAKGIYIGAPALVEQTISGDIVPKTWTEVTAGTEYVAENGIKLTTNKSASEAFYAKSACDNNLSTNWVTNATPSSWIKLEFPNAVKVTKMRISISINSATSNVSSCKIQGSNDNSTWTDLYTFASKVEQGLNEITLTTTMKAKYYRIYSEKTSAVNDPRVYEWQVSEYVGLVDSPDAPNVSHKVKKAYIGVDGIARKIKKGYIGVNGIAQQFYSSEKLVPFTNTPVPTTWTDSSDYLSATATNEYGEWKVSGSEPNNTSHCVSTAFDNSTSSYYIPKTSGSGVDAKGVAYLYLPQGVAINPTTITVTSEDSGNTTNASQVHGRNENGEWVLLGTITRTASSNTDTFTISGDTYYTAFRIWIYKYTATTSAGSKLYDFKISKGTLKIE